MALMKCPECSREISDKAESCPHCGFPVASHSENLKEESVNAENQNELLKEVKQMEDNLKVAKPKDNFVFQVLGVLGLIVVAVVTINSVVETRHAENARAVEHEAQLKASKTHFTMANSLMAKNTISDNEWIQIKNHLSAVTTNSPEYKEAQLKLATVTKRADEIEKQLEQQRTKERKQKEEAGLTAKGKRLRAKHPDWSVDECDAISKGKIGVGMTREQVAAAWGRPYHINKTHNQYGTTEQWVMHEYGNSFVYFDDGICTSIQN